MAGNGKEGRIPARFKAQMMLKHAQVFILPVADKDHRRDAQSGDPLQTGKDHKTILIIEGQRRLIGKRGLLDKS